MRWKGSRSSILASDGLPVKSLVSILKVDLPEPVLSFSKTIILGSVAFGNVFDRALELGGCRIESKNVSELRGAGVSGIFGPSSFGGLSHRVDD